MIKRKNFSTSIPGSARLRRFTGTPLDISATVPARSASESYVYVSRRKPEGWVPPTPYTFRHDSVYASAGSIERKMFYTSTGQVTDHHIFEGRLGTNSTYGNTVLTIDDLVPSKDRQVQASLVDRALIIARSKMKQGDVNLGVAFAERNRTAQLVGDTATQLVKSLRALRRGDWRRAGRELGITNPSKPRGSTIPQKWLELQYGWKPLLSDVYGSADALTRQPRQNWRVTGKGLTKEEFTQRKLFEDLSKRWRGTARGWKGCHIRIDAVPDNDLLMSLSSLGVTNPLLIGWELVPFSFVVDWFLPIGSYLDSLDAMLGYGETWYCESKFSTCTTVYTPESGSFVGTLNRTASFSANASSMACKSVRLDRRVLQGVPLPTMPRLRDGRTLGRMANALSLLAQVFGGRGR